MSTVFVLLNIEDILKNVGNQTVSVESVVHIMKVNGNKTIWLPALFILDRIFIFG